MYLINQHAFFCLPPGITVGRQTADGKPKVGLRQLGIKLLAAKKLLPALTS